MPLSDLKVQMLFQFSLAKPITGWATATQGPNALTFKLGTVDFTQWEEAYGVQFALAGGANTDIDLTTLLNLINEPFSFTSVLALGVGCAATVAAAPNGELVVTPSAAFGFNPITDSLTVVPGGMALVAAPTTDDGYTVDSTHKNLNFSNTGTDSITVTLVVAGSTV